jgi:hypothetical protein
MFWDDHPPPHFHAIFGNHEALVDILTSEIIRGSLPLGAHSLVTQWLNLHRDERLADWELAQSLKPLQRIEPLP